MCCVSFEAERWHQCTLYEWEQVQKEKSMFNVCEIREERWQKTWKSRNTRKIKQNEKTEENNGIKKLTQ